jgi:ADP-heptose:LPS heptosyltransferase
VSLRSIIDGVRLRTRQQRFVLPVPDLDLQENDHRILIVYLFAGMGDAILIAPVLEAILDRHPGVSLGVLLPPLAARTLKLVNMPVKIHQITQALIDFESSDVRRRPKKIRVEQEALIQELCAQEYTLGFDLSCRDGVESRVWLDRSQVQMRLGWIRSVEELDSGQLDYGTLDVRMMTDRHWSVANTLPFKCLGIEQLNSKVNWKYSKSAQSRAQRKWGSGKRILLIPGSENSAKRWSSSAFAQVVQTIAKKTSISTVISGGPQERALVTDLAKQISGPCSTFTGKDLGVLLALILTADLVITNDTGPMHLAFLSEIPTIAIFTHMSPAVWGPLCRGNKHTIFELQTSEPTPQLIRELANKALAKLGGKKP